MRLVLTLLVASAAVGYSQTGARLLGPRPSVVTPGISGTEARAAVPSKPGVEINAWVQVNDAHCPVPLAKAEVKVDTSNNMTAADGKANLPKVTLPAPPCDRAANALVIPKVETRTVPTPQ